MSVEIQEPVTHTLKSWPEYFQPMQRGDKTFEVRVGDERTYKVGDRVVLIEVDRLTGEPTGARALRVITHVMHGGLWLPPAVWVFSIKDPEAQQ